MEGSGVNDNEKSQLQTPQETIDHSSRAHQEDSDSQYDLLFPDPQGKKRKHKPIKVPTIEEDKIKFQDKKPKEIYLDHQKEFIQNFMEQSHLEIKKLEMKEIKKLGERVYLLDKVKEQQNHQLENLKHLYICDKKLRKKIKNIKEDEKNIVKSLEFFSQFHFYDNTFAIIIKTVQKIKIPNDDEKFFWVKTIQIFNSQLKMHGEEIVTEVFGDHIQLNLNIEKDTSVKCIGDKIYFFKRLYGDNGGGEENHLQSFSQKLSDDEDNIQKSQLHELMNENKSIVESHIESHEQSNYLNVDNQANSQLSNRNQEKNVNDNPLFFVYFLKEIECVSHNHIINQNIIASKQARKNQIDLEYQKLLKSYIVKVPYITEHGTTALKSKFEIRKLTNLYIGDPELKVEYSNRQKINYGAQGSFKEQKFNIQKNQRNSVQLTEDMQKTIAQSFMVDKEKQIKESKLEFIAHTNDDACSNHIRFFFVMQNKTFEYKIERNSNNFQQPQATIYPYNIKKRSEDNQQQSSQSILNVELIVQQEKVKQFYFIDNRNQIQLLHPNFKSNKQQNNRIDLIIKKKHYAEYESSKYKRIECIKFHNYESNDNSHDDDKACHGHKNLIFKKHKELGYLFKIQSSKDKKDHGISQEQDEENQDKENEKESLKQFSKQNQFTYFENNDLQVLFIQKEPSNLIKNSNEPKQEINKVKDNEYNVINVWRLKANDMFKHLNEKDLKQVKKSDQEFGEIKSDEMENCDHAQLILAHTESLKPVETYHKDHHIIRDIHRKCQDCKEENKALLFQSSVTLFEDNTVYKNENEEQKSQRIKRENSIKKELSKNQIYLLNYLKKDKKHIANIQIIDKSLGLQQDFLNDFTLVAYQRSDNQKVIFVFQYNERGKYHYFLVFKKDSEMNKLFENEEKDKKFIIDNKTEIMKIVKEGKSTIDNQEKLKLAEPKKIGEIFQNRQFDDNDHNFHLTFNQLNDENSINCMLPFIYQELQNTNSHRLFLLDICTEKIQQDDLNISKHPFLQNVLYKNRQGFVKFKICRSSKIFKVKDNKNLHIRQKIQVLTYFKEHIGCIHNDEYLIDYNKKSNGSYVRPIGQQRIYFSKKLQEQNDFNYLENSYIIPEYQNTDSHHTQNDDCECEIKGCRLIWLDKSNEYQNSKDEQKMMNQKQKVLENNEINENLDKNEQKQDDDPMEESEDEKDLIRMKNNHFKLYDEDDGSYHLYQSEIATLGYRKVLLYTQQKQVDPQIYAVIVSANLDKDLVCKNPFINNIQLQKILVKLNEQLWEMRIADLSQIIHESYQSQKESEFFVQQELLLGRTICDLNLKNSTEIDNAIQKESTKNVLDTKSLFSRFFRSSQVRKYQIGKFKEQIQNKFGNFFLKQNFNLQGTILRALNEDGGYKAVSKILEQIFKNSNTIMNKDKIMQYLPDILEQPQININQFFRQAKNDEKDECYIEEHFESEELPVFQQNEFQYLKIKQIHDQHNWNKEVESQLIQNNKINGSNNKKLYEIDHSFINFQEMILAQKIKKHLEWKIFNKNNDAKSQKEEPEDYDFDDYELCKMLQRDVLSDQGIEFYSCPTVQILVKCQWQKAKVYWKWMFLFFLIFFFIPLSLSYVNDPNYNLHESNEMKEEERIFWMHWCRSCQNYCWIPVSVQVINEFIQLRAQGLKQYCQGWNVVNFLFIILWTFYYCIEDFDRRNSYEITFKNYLAEMRVILFLFAILILMQFVRFNDKMSLLVQMIIMTIKELYALAIFTIMSMILFMMIMSALNMETDPKSLIDGAQGLNLHMQQFLANFLTLNGNLQRPYINPDKVANYSPLAQSFNVQFVSIFWFFQCSFLLILILNFLVCAIFNTYFEVQPIQELMIIKQQADLCLEFFQIVDTMQRWIPGGQALSNFLLNNVFEKNANEHFEVLTLSYMKDESKLIGLKDIDKFKDLLRQFKKNIKLSNQGDIIKMQEEQIYDLKRYLNQLQDFESALCDQDHQKLNEISQFRSKIQDQIAKILKTKINNKLQEEFAKKLAKKQ